MQGTLIPRNICDYSDFKSQFDKYALLSRERVLLRIRAFCRKTGFVANTRLFGFVWCRLLRRHLGFDSDFTQISGLKIGG